MSCKTCAFRLDDICAIYSKFVSALRHETCLAALKTCRGAWYLAVENFQHVPEIHENLTGATTDKQLQLPKTNAQQTL